MAAAAEMCAGTDAAAVGEERAAGEEEEGKDREAVAVATGGSAAGAAAGVVTGDAVVASQGAADPPGASVAKDERALHLSLLTRSSLESGSFRAAPMPGQSSAAAAGQRPAVGSHWTVRLDRSLGQRLGMSVKKHRLTVESIDDHHLIAEWNNAHPDRALREGCRIVEVNGKTDADQIFRECSKSKVLEMTVTRDVGATATWEPGAERSSSSTAADSEARRIQELLHNSADSGKFAEKRCDVSEYQKLVIGPFQANTKCEIINAWYGVPDNPLKQIDVTDIIRERFNTETGLRLGPTFNEVFGFDPAPLRPKRVVVEYRLHNVKEWDVSTGKYVEGMGKITLAVPLLMKAVTNVVGAAAATTGYAVGRVETAIKNFSASPDSAEGGEASVADSEAFQYGFMAWLTMNGIFPSVNFRSSEDKAFARLKEHYHHFSSRGASVPEPLPTDMKQTPILVSNHVSFIDGFVLAAVLNAPKVLSRAGTLSMPLLGTFAGEIGVIEVDRDNKNSRANAMEAMTKHVEEWTPGARPMLIFPEGTTSNGENLLEFKKGAFVTGVPVRPIIILYTGDWNPANTNFKVSTKGEIEPTSDSEWYEQFLGHFIHSMQVEVLPPYIPSERECEDAALYASNVRELMLWEMRAIKAELERKRVDEASSWKRTVQRTLTGEALWDMASSLYPGRHLS